MLRYFNCAVGKIEIAHCLNHCPQSKGRCLSLPTLAEVGYSRDFKRLSVTQLIAPTRIEYLKITEDYSVDPKERAFLLLGTRHHQHLDGVAQKLKCISEKRMISDEITGCADLLEPISGDAYRLIDYKTFGAYAVKKAMKGDTRDISLQLNSYRIMFEEIGFKIQELFIQVTVRDFTAKTPETDGITEKMFLIQIPMIGNVEVKDYFSQKSEALLSALYRREIPTMCDYSERWSNRRCLFFCDVKFACPEGSKMS
jgi:hypothetical protein